MKYEAIIKQYFDTYFEWEKSLGIFDTEKEARDAIAASGYHSRPLVSYCFDVRKRKEREESEAGK